MSLRSPNKYEDLENLLQLPLAQIWCMTQVL